MSSLSPRILFTYEALPACSIERISNVREWMMWRYVAFLISDVVDDELLTEFIALGFALDIVIRLERTTVLYCAFINVYIDGPFVEIIFRRIGVVEIHLLSIQDGPLIVEGYI